MAVPTVFTVLAKNKYVTVIKMHTVSKNTDFLGIINIFTVVKMYFRNTVEAGGLSKSQKEKRAL
jgi:hypothetical protein